MMRVSDSSIAHSNSLSFRALWHSIQPAVPLRAWLDSVRQRRDGMTACCVFLYIITGMNYAYAGVLSDAPPSPLELQITGGASSIDKIAFGLKIINHADHEIVIQRGIEIDKLVQFKWIALMSVEATASCNDYVQADSFKPQILLTRIAAGSSFDMVPFNGWKCGNQCPAACQQNSYLGPGIYQFVVVTAEGQRQPSPSFTLP